MLVNLYAWEYLHGGWLKGYAGDGFRNSPHVKYFRVEGSQADNVILHRARWISPSRICLDNVTFLLWGWECQHRKYHAQAGYWTSPKYKGYSTPRQYIEARVKAEAVAQEFGAG